MCRSLCAFIQDFFRNNPQNRPLFYEYICKRSVLHYKSARIVFCRSFDKLLFSAAPNQGSL